MESTPVRIEELLAHASWVRSLAARLVRDPATAEDVTQEVWASALSSPPRERSNLRGWLSAAVRSAVHSMQRGEQRRRTREEIAHVAREQAGPAELFERAQLHRELVGQVLALEEPLRSIVLAHWFEGSSVAEAGRRLGLSERVARLRLGAAHEVLRQRLDRAHGSRAAWVSALLQWTRSEDVALATASSRGVLAAGEVAMVTKLVLSGVAALIVAWTAWTLLPRAEPRDQIAAASGTISGTPATQLVESGDVASGARAGGREAVSVTPMEAIAVPAPGQATRWLIRGHVSGGPKSSLEQTQLTVRFICAYNNKDAVTNHATNEGSFEIDITTVINELLAIEAPTELLLIAEHPLSLRAQVRIPFASATENAADPSMKLFTCEVALTTGAIVTGRVIVPQDRQSPTWPPGDLSNGSAEVGLFEVDDSSIDGERLLDFVVCDADGQWTLRANHAGEFKVIAAAHGLRPEARPAHLEFGVSTEIEPISLTIGASIAGTVMRAGRPLASGVLVTAQPKLANSASISWGSIGLYMAHSEGNPYQTTICALTDEQGRFRFDGLAELDYELQVTDLPQVIMSLGGDIPIERVVKAPRSDVVLSSLPPLVRLVISIDGRPPREGELGGTELRILPQTPNSSASELDLMGGEETLLAISTEPGTPYEFRINPGRFESAIWFVPALGLSEERDVRLELKTRKDACTLVVRFLTSGPDLIQNAKFAFVDPTTESDVEPTWVKVEPRENGAFVLANLAEGHHRVRVVPYGSEVRAGTPYLRTQFEIDLPSGKTVEHGVPLEVGSRLRLSAKDERGGFVRAAVELRNARGDKVTTEFYCAMAGMTYGCGWYLCEQGINDHPPLPAGHYELKLTADGFEDATASFDLIQGETTTLEIPMRHR